MVSSSSSTPDARHLDIQMQEEFTANSVGSDIFISYSRKDKAFVETLNTALKQLNRDPWVDWDDIQKGEEWWKAIQRGIESANTVIFVISPDSVASTVCRDEVNYAADCHKRFLPIMRREGFDASQLHPAIASHNWLFFRETDDFETAFQELLKAIDTDLDYVREHTRLLVRAIEWQNNDRNSSYLLRGNDLERAEQWLMQAANKTPEPVDVQVTYVQSSLDAEAAIAKARQQAKRTVILTTLLVNMALVTGACIWLYNAATNWAIGWVKQELTTALNVGLVTVDGDNFAALITAAQNNEAAASNQLYQQHQEALARVKTAIPRAFPRSFIASNSATEIIWVGDAFRDIEASTRSATQLGQRYTVNAEQSWLITGLQEVAVSRTVFTDPYGSWMSACGPIRNSAGQVVGGLRIDFTATYVRDVQQRVRNVLLVAYIVIFIWLFVLSLIILRATRTPDVLAKRSDRT